MPARDFFGATVSPPVNGTTALTAQTDEINLFAGTAGSLGSWETWEETGDVGAGRLVATAVEDGGEVVFVAYRLGRGLVFRPGVRGWNARPRRRRLPARDDDQTDMDASAPLDTTLGRLGLIAAALLAAAAVLAERPRLRAAAMAGALVLTPVLLVVEIYDTDQFRTLRDRPAFTAAPGRGRACRARRRSRSRWLAVRCSCRYSRSGRCRSGSPSSAPARRRTCSCRCTA